MPSVRKQKRKEEEEEEEGRQYQPGKMEEKR
jgi:hypothetical protein